MEAGAQVFGPSSASFPGIVAEMRLSWEEEQSGLELVPIWDIDNIGGNLTHCAITP